MKRAFLTLFLIFATGCATSTKSAKDGTPPPRKAGGAAPSDPPTDAEELAAGGQNQARYQSANPATALEEALRDPDPRARADTLEALAPVFARHAEISEMIASVLVQTYAELQDTEKMRTWSRRVQVRDNAAYADVLNAMAYAYAELGEHLAEGLIRLDQALAILDRLEQALPENAAPGARESLRRRRAAFLDTRGWLFFRQGHPKAALEELEKASALLDDPEIHWHRCQAFEALKQSDLAIRACADVASFEASKLAGPARARLKALGALGANLEAVTAAAHKRRSDRRREAVLRSAVDQPTPALTVRGPAGETILLGGEEKPARVQVFWLWATWCKPCLEELPVLEAIAGKAENRDVAFLAINVDEDADLARRYLARRKANIPIAFANLRSSLQALDVGGLPALFVRDPAGRIRFVHLGASPGLAQQLQAEIDSLRASP